MKENALTPAERASASAAKYPLRTAPSMVAGQPVAVQSPARKTRGHCGRLVGTVGIDAGAGRVGGVHFLDHGGLDQIRCTRFREKLADFFQSEVNDLGARFVDEALRGADHEFDVAAG